MGLLDQVIGGVLGQVMGGGRGQSQGGGSGSGMSPIVQALLMLLLQKGVGGGFSDIFGGDRAPAPRTSPDAGGEPDPQERDDGDIGGFGQDRSADAAGRAPREGDYSDLAGMLDGPGGGGADHRSPGAGQYAQLDREASDGAGGFDGLIDRFQRNGLGDVMDSWIGHGQNRPVEPDRLGDALGSETVDTLQQRTGLNRGDLLSQLAKALPGVVDGLTPGGRRPSADERRGW